MLKKIEKIKTSIPLDKTDPVQMWIEEWGNQLLIRSENTDGQEGWGEILTAAGNSSTPYEAILDVLIDQILTSDENNIKELWNKMRRLTFSGGYGITTGAISGVDISLWDLFSRKIGMPLSNILGKRKSAVNRYASLSRYSDPEKAAAAVIRLFTEGYSSIKLHQSWFDTLDTIKIIRKNIGYELELMADLNCSMDFETAREFTHNVSKFELKWIEEPIWPPDDFMSLTKLNKIVPVAAGENFFSIFDFKRLLENDSLSYYQPDVAKIGGVTPMVEIMGLLKAYGASLALHNRPHNGWIGIITSANIACSFDGPVLVETPPNEIPSLFSFDGEMNKKSITPGGNGIGIRPTGNLPAPKNTKLLKFH